MTLATVPRYDPAQITETGDHAVVVGAGVGGLLAARVLADAFDRVTVFDRDPLPATGAPRRGVPQGHHVHTLLEAGRATLADLLPGYGEALLRAGGLLIDASTDLRLYDEGGYYAPPPDRNELLSASRPLFERVLSREVAARDGVDLRGERRFVDYRSTDGRAVDGVVVRADGVERTLAADLVVDATGRASRTPQWLERHGYRPPPTDEVRVDVTYSSVRIERPPGDRRMLSLPPSAPRTRGGAAFPVERDQWLVTLIGMHDTDPPTDVAAFSDYAAELPEPDLRRLLETHDPVADEVTAYPFPTNCRRRYERLERFPAGLVVLGDALCSFNPVYGQGMSVAALEALQLHHTLASSSLDAVGPRFFARAEETVDAAWRLAVGADLAFERTEGQTPLGTALFDRYFSRAVRAAHTDPTLTEAIYRVLGLEVPPSSLLRPRLARRVLCPSR